MLEPEIFPNIKRGFGGKHLPESGCFRGGA